MAKLVREGVIVTGLETGQLQTAAEAIRQTLEGLGEAALSASVEVVHSLEGVEEDGTPFAYPENLRGKLGMMLYPEFRGLLAEAGRPEQLISQIWNRLERIDETDRWPQEHSHRIIKSYQNPIYKPDMAAMEHSVEHLYGRSRRDALNERLARFELRSKQALDLDGLVEAIEDKCLLDVPGVSTGTTEVLIHLVRTRVSVLEAEQAGDSVSDI
jgi:hypothetical protein